MRDAAAFELDEKLRAALANLEKLSTKRDTFLVDLLREIVACAPESASIQQAEEVLRPFCERTSSTLEGPSRDPIAFSLTSLLEAARAAQNELGFSNRPLTVHSVFFTAVGGRGPFWKDDRDKEAVDALASAGLSVASVFSSPESSQATYAAVGSMGVNLSALARRWASPPLGEFETLPRHLRSVLVQLFAGYRVPILVGEPGVGKSTIARQVAYLLHKRDPSVHHELYAKRVLSVTRADLLANTSDRGALEQRTQHLVELADRRGYNIVFLDEIHSLFDGSRDAGIIANILKSPMAEGRLRCFGATTRQEFDRYLATEAALVERLKLVPVPEPSRDEVIGAFTRAPGSLLSPEELDGWEISPAAQEAAVDLSIRYLPLERLPRKAANLLRSAVADQRFEPQSSEKVITPQHVRAALGELLDLDPQLLNADPKERAAELSLNLKADVKGHDEAVETVAECLAELSAAREQDVVQRRPLASLLLYGPPGIGKHTFARAIAQRFFATGGARRELLTEISVAGFDGAAGVNSFRGAPPGYVGYSETRTIFTDVRTAPRRVVLIREIDRAAGLADHIIPILEEGIGFDGRGVATDFTSSVVIFLATQLVQDAGLIAEYVDRCIGLSPLSGSGLRQIAYKMLGIPYSEEPDPPSVERLLTGARKPADIARNYRRNIA